MQQQPARQAQPTTAKSERIGRSRVGQVLAVLGTCCAVACTEDIPSEETFEKAAELADVQPDSGALDTAQADAGPTTAADGESDTATNDALADAAVDGSTVQDAAGDSADAPDPNDGDGGGDSSAGDDAGCATHGCPKHSDPCMTFACQGDGSCKAAPIVDNSLCDFEGDCTANDTCQGGTCTPGTLLCACLPDSFAKLPLWKDHKAVKSGSAFCAEYASASNKCLGKLFCDTTQKSWKCAPLPASVITNSCPPSSSACLKSGCNPTTGQCQLTPVTNGTKCDDANPCTPNDNCQAGACESKVDICKCTSQNAAQKCAYLTGNNACIGVYCDTSDPVATNWDCKLNPAAEVKCSKDGDTECSVNACDKTLGKCAMTPHDLASYLPAGCGTPGNPPCKVYVAKTPTGKVKPCDDGNPCTASETCFGGTCGAPDPVQAQKQKADADPKNDNDPTGGEGTLVCTCVKDADCYQKDDGDLCNGLPYCTKVHSKCVLNPATVTTCPSAFDTDCVVNFCHPASGTCAITPRTHLLPIKTVYSGGTTFTKFVALPYPTGLFVGCDDGDPCTVNDECTAAACKPGTTSVCSCKQDTDCVDDGDVCNGTPYCSKATGQCRPNPATAIYCPTASDTACVRNHCDPKTGQCALTPVKQLLVPCDDGNVCTVGDFCDNGACATGTAVCMCLNTADCVGKMGDSCSGTLYCDTTKAPYTCKPNPATVVVCDPSLDTECRHNTCDAATGTCSPRAANDYLACDDGDPCTPSSTCEAGQCASGASTCGCTADADCNKYSDTNNKCAPTLYCDKAQAPYQCRVAPASVPECDSGSDACRPGACDPQTGKCGKINAPPSTPCQDGQACTVGDVCDGSGTCKAGAQVCGCASDQDCGAFDDGDPCNGTLFCDKSAQIGACRVKPGSAVVCDKTQSDCLQVCDPGTGKCVYEKPLAGTCDDANACTTDTCDGAGNCGHMSLPDGTPDTVGGVCVAGKATAVPTGMRLVPAGTVQVGCNPLLDVYEAGKPRCQADETPLHAVKLASFWMDRFEVTVSRYAACVKAGKCKAPDAKLADCTYNEYVNLQKTVTDTKVLAQVGNLPMTCVNHADARALCAFEHTTGDLPSEAQWTRAARGGCDKTVGDCINAARSFPWGEQNELPGCIQAVLNAKSKSGCGGSKAQVVGSRSASDAGPYGGFDFSGNVREWTADGYDAAFYGKPDATKEDAVAPKSAEMCVRGGSFATTADYGRIARRGKEQPDHVAVDLGLRCVRAL